MRMATFLHVISGALRLPAFDSALQFASFVQIIVTPPRPGGVVVLHSSAKSVADR